MILLSLMTAWATDEWRPVHAGDTVESLAEGLGNPALVPEIREMNGLGVGEQPIVGTLVRLPAPLAVGSQEAFLISMSRKATVQVDGGEPVPLKTFEPIPLGAEFCTVEGRATVRLASTCSEDGSASDDITLNEDTCLVVTTSNSGLTSRATVVQVKRGSIAVLSQADANGHVTVVTPSGITSGPAGGFRVTLEDGAMRTETLSGTATVAGSGAEVSLKPAQGSRVKTGEVPSEPRDLLRTERLLSPADPSVLLRPSFRWADVEGAFAYQFEIGSGVDFREVLYMESTSTPEHDPLALMLPYDQLDRVFWRVSTLDRFGFLGVPSDPHMLTFPPALR